MAPSSAADLKFLWETIRDWAPKNDPLRGQRLLQARAALGRLAEMSNVINEMFNESKPA